MKTIKTVALGAAFAASTCGSLATASAPANATDNTQTVYQYFVNKGLTPVQAAAITGNFMQESSPAINPRAMQNPQWGGRGIAQWEAKGRWDTYANDNMTSFAAQRGLDRWGLQPQLDFTWFELQNYSNYGLASLRRQTTIDGATLVFSSRFEGPSMPDNAQRIAYAKQVYARNNGGDAPTGQVVTSLPVLRQGSTGPAVRTLQNLLGTTADGIFGPATASAVRTFQSGHGLSADGVVGGNTWNALTPTLRQGASGTAVRALQVELNAAGAHLDTDGIFGPGTTAAVKSFQSGHKLAADGVVGDNTWSALVAS